MSTDYTAFEKEKSPSNNINTAIIETQRQHVRAARLPALREWESCNHAVGQELAANSYVYYQCINAFARAALELSPTPIIEAAQPLESAASTIPTILPLLGERAESGRSYRLINNLAKRLRKNPSPHVYDVARQEIKDLPKLTDSKLSAEDIEAARNILNPPKQKFSLKAVFQREDSDSEKSRIRKGADFAGSILEDWWEMVTPKNYFQNARTIIFNDFGSAITTITALPCKIIFNIEAAQNQKLLELQLELIPETLAGNLKLEINPDTNAISVSQNALDRKIKADEKRLNKRRRRAIYVSLAVGGSANFIQNETSQYMKHTMDIANKDVDPVSAFNLAAVLFVAHLIPASLTLGPLKKASQKFVRHCDRIDHLNQQLNLLRYIKKTSNNTSAITPEKPAPEIN